MPVRDDEERPYKLPRRAQLDELSPDQMVAVVMRLAMEISVLRDRLQTHEQLLESRQVLSSEDIEQYTPSKDESESRREARNRLIESIINDLS